MDGGEKKEPALIADCCWWKAACPSVDLLMKGKQRHAFPSLALISPLSRGPLWTHIGGGWMEGNAPQTERRRRGTKGKQKGRVGGYLFLLCCCQCVSVKIIWTSVNEAQICGCFDFRVYMHTFIYIYIYCKYVHETAWYSCVTNYLLKHCISCMITKLLYS